MGQVVDVRDGVASVRLEVATACTRISGTLHQLLGRMLRRVLPALVNVRQIT